METTAKTTAKTTTISDLRYHLLAWPMYETSVMWFRDHASDVYLQNDTKDNADDHKTTLSPRPGAAPSEEKVRRDEWMTMPPTQDDLAARMDPSKIRARGFNTGKGARARAAGDGNDGSSTWHETPEQKRKRLADEVMGVATQAPTQLAPLGKSSGVRSEAEAKKIRENMVRYHLTMTLCRLRAFTTVSEYDSRSSRMRP